MIGATVTHAHVTGSTGTILADNGTTYTVAWTWGTCETQKERVRL